MDDTSRSVLYETLRRTSRDAVHQAASSPKKLFLAHVALQKQCTKTIRHEARQCSVERAGLRCQIQEMERRRDRYRAEKRRIEEQRRRIADILRSLDERRALLRREREKTFDEIGWLEKSHPSDRLPEIGALRSVGMALDRMDRWKRLDRTSARQETAAD